MTYFRSPLLSNDQKQVLLGTLLGNSSVIQPKNGKNCYLQMSGDDRWLKFKADFLKPLAAPNPFSGKKWHSSCMPIINEFKQLLYKNNKKVVDMNVLDSLRDIGLAIWYGDLGSLRNNNIVFNTNKFGKSGSKTIAKYFKEVFGAGEVITERNSYRVVLDRISNFMRVVDCFD